LHHHFSFHGAKPMGLFIGFGWPHKLADGVDDLGDGLVVRADLTLQLGELLCQFIVTGKQFEK
jgi:hypothetical protein